MFGLKVDRLGIQTSHLLFLFGEWSKFLLMNLDYELQFCRLVDGHKSMVTFYHLQRYEEPLTKPRFLSQRDHSFFSGRLSRESRYRELMGWPRGRTQ